jgi:hypothetical protein
MHTTALRRFVFNSSMVPGERYRSVLDPFRDQAGVIEAAVRP